MKNLRKVFADTVLEIGKKDKKVVVVVGDISHGIFKPFREKFPKRYFNIGILEQAMISVCAGFNKVGLIPIIHTISSFLIERTFEQIKLDFGYQRMSGNFVSVGSTFDYAALGCNIIVIMILCFSKLWRIQKYFILDQRMSLKHSLKQVMLIIKLRCIELPRIRTIIKSKLTKIQSTNYIS